MNLMMISADRWVVAGERGPFYYMLEEFSKHWDRIDVIGRRPDQQVQDTVFGNVHLHHPASGRLGQIGFISQTGKTLALERHYAAITSHDYAPFLNGLGAFRVHQATGIPVLSELHHVGGHPRAAGWRDRFDLFCSRRYVAWADRWAAGFRSVNSVEMPDLFASWGVARDRIHVLYSLYLDFETFGPGPEIEPDVDVTFCGRLVPNKGVPDLLRACAQAADSLGGLRIRLIGRGPLESQIDALAKSLGLSDAIDRVAWVDSAEDLATLYRRSRLVVCTSYNEGGPRVAPEAMLCGTPAISTRVGIMPEIIEHGVTGWLYDGDPSSLSALLVEALGTPDRLATVRQSLRDTQPLARFERTRVLRELAEGIQSLATRS